jgi:hypothetical protein
MNILTFVTITSGIRLQFNVGKTNCDKLNFKIRRIREKKKKIFRDIVTDYKTNVKRGFNVY